MQPRTPKHAIQGEGDCAAAIRSNSVERALVESGKVAKRAGRAAPNLQQVAKGQGSLNTDKLKSPE